MARYYTTRCGGCNTAWQSMESGGWRSHIGPPIIKCRRCGTLNKTGKVLPRDMDSGDKFTRGYEDAGHGLSGIFWIVIGGLMLFGGMSEGSWLLGIIGAFGLLVGVGSLISLSEGHEDEDEALQDIYDENGGFLWSDEYYG